VELSRALLFLQPSVLRKPSADFSSLCLAYFGLSSVLLSSAARLNTEDIWAAASILNDHVSSFNAALCVLNDDELAVFALMGPTRHQAEL